MSTESQFWVFLRDRLVPFGRLVRVENPAGPGTPDLYYNLRGRSGWIELKHLDNLPSQARSPLVHDKLTKEQVDWLMDEADAGGRAFLLLRGGRSVLLLRPPEAEAMFYRQLPLAAALARAALVTTIDAFKPAELCRCLTS